MKKTIRLGTRGSPLALIQAEDVKHRLLRARPDIANELEIEIVPIRTTGDWKPEHKDKRFVELGGNKGLFTKEIEEALADDHIDVAVHSMKDVPSILQPEFALAAIIERADPRDAFICQKAHRLEDLAEGAVVGTSSLRRQAQILAVRPDLRVVPLRGNVETRLKKLEDGLADATILAVSGLARLGVESRIASILPTTIMLPAGSQGALGVEIRAADDDLREIFAPIDHAPTRDCITAERAVMRAVDGTCNTPAGAYAVIGKEGLLEIEALVARSNGQDLIRLQARGPAEEAEKIGEELGTALRQQSPADLFAA